GDGCSKIILEKPRTAVSAGKEPHALIAILPCHARKKGSDRSSSGLPRQQPAEKIASRTEECHQAGIYRPGIIALTAIKRRRRDAPAAARTGQKDIDMSTVHFKLSAQVARPRLLVRNSQRLARTTLP